MKTVRLILVVLLVVSIHSCKKKTSRSNSYSNDSETYYYDEDEEAYPDDTYCADVDYYNPDTGFSNNYTLNVDVEYNEVVKISFSSGWLDSSEFSSEELDEDGYCEITLYDGREFEIQITGSACSFDDGYRIETDIQDEIAAVTCPRCGFSKYEYDDYCDDCQDRIDKTCSRCGQYDAFMWAGDELCSDCEEEEQEEDDW
ncbi:hypothetical protein [Gaetbulibacter aestuarii]|uniref:Uncharacterized protein n=1 Tax=Gaetbulibacter aestuarii TaxID=1502358 RepID=A0ABW7N182_9FLAO